MYVRDNGSHRLIEEPMDLFMVSLSSLPYIVMCLGFEFKSFHCFSAAFSKHLE